MTKEEKIKFWSDSAERDYKAMENLFASKDYSWSLFIGHLVVEKLLKALYIKKFDIEPPYIHNLLIISDKLDFILSEEQKDDFSVINSFNLKARYSDYKEKFSSICTRDFTNEWIIKIREIVKWIKEKF